MFLSVFDKWTFSREQKVCKWNIAAARQIGDLHIIGIFICSSYELPKTCCCDLCIHLWTLHMKWGKLSNTQMNSYYLYLCLLVDSTLKNRQVFLLLTGLPKRGHFCSFLGDNWAVKPCHAVAIIDRLLMLRCTTDTFSNLASINNLTKQVYYFKSIICNDKTYMRYGYIHKRP